MKLKSFYAEMAKANQIRKPANSVSQNPIDTQKELAKKSNVSHDTINKVERINEVLEKKPDDELKKQLIEGA